MAVEAGLPCPHNDRRRPVSSGMWFYNNNVYVACTLSRIIVNWENSSHVEYVEHNYIKLSILSQARI